MQPQPVPERPYKRDQLTWLGYLLYGFWSFVWGLFGPLMPFLRSELHIDYTVASLHFSALALGPLLAGIFGYRLISTYGAARVVGVGVASVVSGISLVYLGTNAFATIFGAWLIGVGGSHAGQATIASLSQRDPEHSTKSVTELVLSGSVFAAIAPLVVAEQIKLELPWKSALLICLPIMACIWLITKPGRTERFTVEHEPGAKSQPLPNCYWFYFAIVFFSVAAEWSVCFWCPTFLETVRNFTRPDASSSMTAFLAAMLVGRFSGRKLMDMISPRLMLCGTAIIAFSGFLLFWLSSAPPMVLSGLVMFGLGTSNIFPLALSLAIKDAPMCKTKAASRMSLSTGSAILLVPFILGMTADRYGLLNAYGIVAALLCIAMFISRFAAKQTVAPELHSVIIIDQAKHRQTDDVEQVRNGQELVASSSR